MTNEESESVDATPEPTDDGEATVVKAPEVPGVEASEEPAADEATADGSAEEPKAKKKTIALIAGATSGFVVAIAVAVIVTLAITSSGFFSKSSKPGDPAGVVTQFFNSTTCAGMQALQSPGYWEATFAKSTDATTGATTPCTDSGLKQQLSTTKAKVKSEKVAKSTAQVVVTLSSVATATTPSQSADFTVYLVLLDGHWKVDMLHQKTS